MNKWIAMAKAFWASLPHEVQALLVFAGSGAAVAAGRILDSALTTGTFCASPSCLKHDLWIVLLAGAASARAFYMFPNRRGLSGPSSPDPSSPAAPPPQPPSTTAETRVPVSKSMKTFATFATLLWQHGLIALLCAALVTGGLSLTACNPAQVQKVETDITKFSPVILNVLNLGCSFTPAAALCATGKAALTEILAKLSPALSSYQNNLAAGTATNEEWNALNALFATFEQQSGDILSLLRVSSGASTAEARNVGNDAETLLSVLEALFPQAPPATPVSVTAARSMVPRVARSARFTASLPASVAFPPHPSKEQARAESAWAQAWVKDYNRKVDAARKAHPQAGLEKVGGGVWAGMLNGLGNAVGEAKFGQ